MAKEKQGFYYQNTVEIDFQGRKVRVNKFEADALKKKLAKKSK